MTRGSAIRGRVVLLDENATPRPPRSVSAEPANGDPALGLILGRLDLPESGAFAIEGLRSGAYLLNLFGGGTWLVRSIQWQGREWRDAAFDTTAGQQYDGVVVTATLQAATIGGTVRNAQGFAAAGAGVIVFPADPSGWREYGLQPDRLRAVTANADGRFQITRMPAGEYRLIAVERAMTDAWKDPAFLERAAGQSTRLTIDWGQSAQQDLTMRTVGGQ
jgi:hypothetical protein